MPDQLGELAAILLAVSLASERLVVLAKTLLPKLASDSDAGDDERATMDEKTRRLTVMGVGLVAAWVTVAFLVPDPDGTMTYWRALFSRLTVAGHDFPVPILAILASGGSAFWAQVLGYASALKDAQRRVTRLTAEAPGKPPAPAPDPPAPPSDDDPDLGLGQRAAAHLTEKYGSGITFVPDGDVQRTSAGVQVVHLIQEHAGVPVYEHAASVRFGPDGAVLGSAGEAATMPAGVATHPSASAIDAAELAAVHVAELVQADPDLPAFEIPPGTATVVTSFPRPSLPTVLRKAPFEDEVTCELCYSVEDDGTRLAWLLQLICAEGFGEYEVLVSADGLGPAAVLFSRKTVAHAVSGDVFEFSPDEGGGGTVTRSFPLARDHYPSFGGRVFPSGAGGWVEIDETKGNNTFSYQISSGEPLKGAVSGPDVHFGPDPASEDQRLLNAFYLGNLLHDFFLLIGFDEEAGNFQEQNFSDAGEDSDSLVVKVYDSAFQGIASMRSRRDGKNPKLKLGLHQGRHSALDSELVAHEFVHGVTNRIIGGRRWHDPLRGKQQSAAMGEGYSDYFALTILNYFRRKDGRAENMAFGGWLADDAATGLRKFAYDAFPGTYADLGDDGYEAAHNAGQVWGKALFDLNAAIAAHADRETGDELGWQIVMDSLKLITPGRKAPTYLHGRDAVLHAYDDLVAVGGIPGDTVALRASIVDAFTQLGMGPAAQSSSAKYSAIVADFGGGG